MTGEGTTTNPYIPESWADFKIAVGTNGSYVNVPEGTVYDLDKLEPNGISCILWNAELVKGNGLIIKNGLYTSNLIASNISSGKYNTIQNVNFKGFLVLENSEGVIYRRYTNNSSNLNCLIKNCSFVGDINRGLSLFYTPNQVNKIQLKYVYIELTKSGNETLRPFWNGSATHGGYFLDCAFCVMHFNCPTLMPTNSTGFNAEFCFISGTVNTNPIITGSCCVSIAKGNHQAVNTANKLLTTGNVVSGSNSWTQLSDEQIKDREYIKSIIFPIL